MTAPRAWTPARVLVVAALVIAIVAIVVIAVDGGEPYRVRILFADAGQLVDGDLVEVGGIPIGTVTSLDLTRNSVAQVTVSLDPGRYSPLHAGTRASIGTVGLSGVTNRFVALSPGPADAPRILDGGVLPETATTPIVDIDEVLDSITPPVRRNLRSWIQSSPGVLRGNIGSARATLGAAAAGLERTDAFVSQLTADRAAFSGLLRSGARTASVLASRQPQLTSGIADTATAFAAIARARGALASSVQRAPAVLAQGTSFLRRLGPVLSRLDPVLRDAQPVAVPLSGVLRAIVPTTAEATPVLGRLNAVLPRLVAALDRLPGLRRTGVPALDQTITALRRAEPIFTGVRPYGEDILLGFLHGYGGGSSENYDANGQFSRIALGLPAPSLLTSVLGFDIHDLSPHFLTGQTNKCPGSAAEPAPDNANHILASGCDPQQVP